MPRTAKPRPPERQLNVDLPCDVVDGLDEFCDGMRWAKKKAVELALRRFLARESAVPDWRVDE